MPRALPLALIAVTLAAACADDRCEGAGCCATSMDCPGARLAAGVERCVPGRCEEVYAGPRPNEGPLFEAPTRPPQRSIHPMPPYPSLVSGP